MIQAYDYWQNQEVKYGRDVPTPPLGQYCQVVGRSVGQLKD